MNRIRLAAAVAACVVISSLAVTPAAARPIQQPAGLSAYDRALLAHTSLDPVVKGERIMGGEDFAAEAAAHLTAGVTQNGVCNDQKAEAQVGETRIFWVHNFKLGMDIQKTFVLMTKTPHVYFWVDVTQTNTLVTQSQADAASHHFESIYDTNRAYFGEPARCDQLPHRQPPRMQEIWGGPWYDADDDPHINIVNFDPDVGATVVAGYYSSADEYPVTVNEHSNEGEFFYMNSLLFAPGTATYDSILAHEFYHMVQFANDANEETWINEGMADVAIEVNGFASLTASHTSDYSANAGDQLTNWDGQLYDYGNAYTYLSYLLEHYGPPDDPATPSFNEAYGLADDITKVEGDGIAGLDTILASNPHASQLDPYYQGRTANDVYLDRAVANLLNDRSIDAGQYGYGTLSSFQVQPDGEFDSYPQDVTVEGAHVYGDHSYVFDSLGDGSFSVEADARIQIVANTPTSGTHELWSNRGDEMETWAERAADLTGTTSPRLRFNYWHDIEEDWDYAYLQVSEDGGATWTNLACCGSRNTNPNGNNRGNGITGRSLASPLDAEPSYLQADVDLSAYAGKQIVVRFLYVADPAVNEPGLTLDDVTLVDGGTTIWPVATFEAGADGFVLGGNGALTFRVIEPTIPNGLRLQLVNLGSAVEVDRPATTTGAGSVSAQGAMDATRTIAIVSSLTPITSETFDFTFHAQASAPAELQAPVLRDPGETVKRNKKFALNWTPAGPAGNLQPQSYRVQEATVNAVALDDDAEDGLGSWTATTTGVGAVGWQGSSAKVQSPDTAFWASALEGAVDTSALLTLRQPVTVPTTGTSTLSFWDWHVNESDDQVAVEVSTDGGTTWEPIFQTGRSMTADEAAAAFATEPMGEHRIDLAAYAGRSILLRFRFSAGSANRPGSTPFGWYVDDVRIDSQNWSTIATVTGLKHTIQRKTTGTYFYRVTASYSANVTGPWSNVVDVRVA